MYRSINTVGADVARREHGATGEGIVWAILDSGIDAAHPHFQLHRNLELDPSLRHRDFTQESGEGAPLVDENGHGTYVAGIVAGERPAGTTSVAVVSATDENGEQRWERSTIPAVSGMAPLCKLVSMKVLDANGEGPVSRIIEALRAIQEINVDGRALRIHGALLAVGYDYDVERFECGLSPLCVEVDRLVRTGVVVVAAAGNRGFGYLASRARQSQGGMEVSIDDPGNAESAITVGSTHRELPRLYGVSYFSGKGPTVDGRYKPDLVAPGSGIVSCATGIALTETRFSGLGDFDYTESSGTAPAAAHVAGTTAAFLSVRPDFIGRPDAVKQVFMSSATDLQRDRYYQGRGLVNLRAALAAPRDAVAPAPPAARVAAKRVEPAVAGAPRPLRLMCSYSHRDAPLRKELDVYIAPLKRQGLVASWYDGEIDAGGDLDAEISTHMEAADIIVLLISADFLASNYCYEIEMKRALERHDEGTLRVIPVIVRESDWTSAPFHGLKALPKDGAAVTSWTNQDAAWTDVALGIRRAVEHLRKPPA